MKYTFWIFPFAMIIMFFSCKKDKKAYNTTYGPSSTFTPETVENFDEKNGNVRLYKVTETIIKKADSLSPSVIQSQVSYNCTLTIVGDTIISGNIPAKLYQFTFSNGLGPCLSYTYYKDSLWHFIPMSGPTPYLTKTALKLPLTVGHYWLYSPLGTETEKYSTTKYQFNANISSYGYTIEKLDDTDLLYEINTCTFVANRKGLPIIYYDYQQNIIPKGGYQIQRYELQQTWSNF